MTPRLDMVAVSDRGRIRANNEDCVAVEPALGLAVLADGMGGHNAGEVASRMAVEAIVADAVGALGASAVVSAPDARALLVRIVGDANARIYAEGFSNPDRAGMGTTVVAALWHATSVTVAHVGDSRFYRLRAGALTQLTRDHTLVQEALDQGALTPAQARLAATRNVLTRALGAEAQVEIDAQTHATEGDDVYLLCSDGLTEMLADDEIAAVLKASQPSLRDAADELVRRANQNGGVDNVSVAIVRGRRP